MSRRKKQHGKKLLIVWFCACILVLLMSQTAYAAEGGTLSVYYRQDDVRFSIYRVTDESGALVDGFSDGKVRIPSDGDSADIWQEAAQTLEHYAAEHAVECSRQGDTHSGVVRFEGLAAGLYLIRGDLSIIDQQKCRPIPALVRVSDGAVEIYAKYEIDETDDQTETTPPAETHSTSKSTMPQTGQFDRLIPLLAVLVLSLLSAAWILRSSLSCRKGRHR